MAAAAHGLPVVAVRQPGGRDQAEFRHGEHVWFAGHSTAEDLAVGIQALMEDRVDAARMARNVRQLYETRFDWGVTAAIERKVGTDSEPEAVSVQPDPVETATTVSGAKS
jgi:glycosyltransferase involved in cell wall biosynthesis